MPRENLKLSCPWDIMSMFWDFSLRLIINSTTSSQGGKKSGGGVARDILNIKQKLWDLCLSGYICKSQYVFLSLDNIVEVNLWMLLLFSHSVMFDSFRPHRIQYARFPHPSSSPGPSSNSCPLSWRCHPTISFYVVPFSSCLQSFSASKSFLMIQLFVSGGQSIGTSASASVLPMNI